MKLVIAMSLIALMGCSTTATPTTTTITIQQKARYHAYDLNWLEVGPTFSTKQKAREYADKKNMDISEGGEATPTGHSYQVRSTMYRYEVRHHRDIGQDYILYETNSLTAAKTFFRTLHVDDFYELCIYDFGLKNGQLNVINVNTLY